MGKMDENVVNIILDEIKELELTSEFWGPGMGMYSSNINEWIKIDNGKKEAKIRLRKALSEIRKK